MKSLKDRIKAIEKSKENTTDLEANFLKDFNKALLSKESVQTHPKGLFRPSSIHGCARMLYLQQMGYKEDEKNLDDEWMYKLISICECGTDRHTRIQQVVQRMEELGLVKIVNIEEQVKEANKLGLDTEFVKWNHDKTEARCKSDRYRMYFQPDGLIEYQGVKCILEIKTINGFKFKSIQSNGKPKPEHIEQATCYATMLGVNHILFIYEENNFKTKWAYLHSIDDFDKRKMATKIDKMVNYLETEQLPPREKDKCIYCKHKTICKELGE